MNEQNIKIKKSSWWKRRTRIEKWLFPLLATLVIVIIIILSVRFAQVNQNGTQQLCYTSDCVKTAAQVLERADLGVNPCDDFYNFACGNFIKHTPMLPYQTSVSAFTILEDVLDEQMRSLFEEPVKATDSRAFVIVKSIYQACMNKTEIEANSLKDLKSLLKSIGGWPVVEGINWRETTFDWKTTSYRFMQLGIDTDFFYNIMVKPDISNSSRKIIMIDQPHFSVFDKNLRDGFNDSVVRAYYDYAVKVAVAFGADPEKATEEMRNVVDFIIQINKILVPFEDRIDFTQENNQMTIKQLEQEYVYVPWLDFINKKLYPVKEMTYNDVVVVTVPAYFNKLENVLKTTPKRTLSNYIYWRVVRILTQFLSDDVRNLDQKFIEIKYGNTEATPRWKECVANAKYLHVASGALYVRHFFKHEAKATLAEMVEKLKDSLIETLKNLDWMDELTKKHAVLKAQKIYAHIAYPDELLDEQKLNDYHKHLTVNPAKYLESFLNVSAFGDRISFAELDKVVDKNDWRQYLSATAVNAVYNRNTNGIKFSAGILQGVFFDNDRPQYMNYGAVGHIIGHELVHGFDNAGRQFDKDGNLVDWWQPKTKSAFDAKFQCIIDQYSNFTVPEIDLNLNGKRTRDENIADNGGIKQAYLAYKKWSEEHELEPALPGLNFTPEQMFWISAGNVWCEVHTLRQLAVNVMNLNHAPSYYRANVPLMNSEFFAKDFNCPVGSRMNPVHKCVVF